MGVSRGCVKRAKFTDGAACHAVNVPEIVEQGDVLFFYRPTVQPAEAPPDLQPGVQAFYVVLSPANQGTHRRVRIGKKRMPKSERLWARVERVGDFARVIGDQINDEVYTTKTRGDRFQPGARPVAQGCYAFVRHGDHTHFVYRVDRDEADAPEDVRVPEVGDSVVLFEREPTEDSRAIWSAEGEVRWLDREGEELVFVGVDEDPEDVLGLDIAAL
jgi:hypothetical protein